MSTWEISGVLKFSCQLTGLVFPPLTISDLITSFNAVVNLMLSVLQEDGHCE